MPVKTSILSLPAALTSSNAPLKSPLNTFLTALAKNPKVSRKLSNLSTILALILSPNALTVSNGFSNIALKKSTTAPPLSTTNLQSH